ARLPGVEVVHEPGATRGDLLPVLDERLAPGGVRFDYRADADGDVLLTTTLGRLDPVWSGHFADAVDPRHFHVRASATLVPTSTGPEAFDVTSVGPCMVQLDGEVLLDNSRPTPGLSFFGMGSVPAGATVDLVDSRPYRLEVEYARPSGSSLAGLRVGAQPP